MAFLLVCPNCPDPYSPPLVDGVATLRPDLLTTLQTSQGPRFTAMCPPCADRIIGGTMVSPT